MLFTTALFLYAIFITVMMNFYGAVLGSARNSSNAVESEALQTATTQNDQIEHVRQKIHGNTVIGSTIQAIMDWIHANKLAPLQFDIKQDFNCHRGLAKAVIVQLLACQRVSVLFQDMYGQTNVTIASAIAKLALVAMGLEESTAILATVTEVLLSCNDCSALNFIRFGVNQNTSIEQLPHIQQSMEFETLLIAADDYRDTNNALCDQQQQHDTTPSNKSVERVAVSALEKINRLQAAAGFIVPTSMHDIASEKSGRRISNSSTLTNSSGISSSICVSPSISSASTSDTSLTSYDISKKERTASNVDLEMVQPNEATYYDIIKFKTDLLHIKLEADHLLNQIIIPLSRCTSSRETIHRVKQVNQAFNALVAICIDTESALNNLQYGFAFDQLATQISSRLIDEAYSKLHQQTILEDYQESDFRELTAIVNKAFDVTTSIVKAFSNPTTVPNSYYARYIALVETLMNKCTQLGSAYKSIDSVYKGVIEIRTTVQEGRNALNTLQYGQETSMRNLSTSLTAIQSIFTDIYNCSTQKVQPLYETLRQQINFSRASEYQSEEKIVVNMVNRLFQDIDSIKTEIKRASQELIRSSDKQDVEANICQAKGWLKTMNYSLGLFIALEALFSFESIDADQEALKDRFTDFQERFSEFTLTTYNEVCSYFAEDYDAGLNYQKLGDDTHTVRSKEEEYMLFDDLQQLVDQTSILLSYAHQVLESIASNTPLPSSTSYEHMFACFSNIQFPQLNIDGLSNMFYYYHHELYVSLSQTKVNLIIKRLQ
ncbi:hypothetical protein PS6_010482 [Mucor atramentarius]